MSITDRLERALNRDLVRKPMAERASFEVEVGNLENKNVPSAAETARERFDYPAPTNPLQDALENYNHMKDELAAAKDELRQMHQQSVSLFAENDQLRKQIEFFKQQHNDVRKERDMYQAYAVEIRTRVATLREMAAQTEVEAMKLTVNKIADSQKQALDKVAADKAADIAADIAEQESAAQIVAALPPRTDEAAA